MNKRFTFLLASGEGATKTLSVLGKSIHFSNSLDYSVKDEEGDVIFVMPRDRCLYVIEDKARTSGSGQAQAAGSSHGE